ncbi:MAG: DNA polymerase I, partial [Sphingomonas sp.]
FIHEPDGEKLIAYLKAMEFNTLTRRVAAVLGEDASAIASAAIAVDGPARGPDLDPQGGAGRTAGFVPAEGAGLLPMAPAHLVAARREAASAESFDRSAYVTIRDAETLNAWMDKARETGILAFDVESTSLNAMTAELVGVSFAVRPGEAAYLPLAHVSAEAGDLLASDESRSGVGAQVPLGAALEILKAVLEDASILKIGQNFKYDYLVMLRYGIAIAGFDDTMLISYALDASSSLEGHGMDELSERFLGHKPISYKELCGSGKSLKPLASIDIARVTEYAAEDADVTLRLWRVLKPRLVAEGLISVYERLERPLVAVLARMEQRGIRTDRQILSRLSGRFAQKAAALESEIAEMAGEAFNPGSPKQLGDILFGKLGLPGGKKTKTGQWSTDAKVLEDLAAEGHVLPRHIVDWRQLTKLKGTYTDALPAYMDREDRIHTS